MVALTQLYINLGKVAYQVDKWQNRSFLNTVSHFNTLPIGILAIFHCQVTENADLTGARRILFQSHISKYEMQDGLFIRFRQIDSVSTRLLSIVKGSNRRNLRSHIESVCIEHQHTHRHILYVLRLFAQGTGSYNRFRNSCRKAILTRLQRR